MASAMEIVELELCPNCKKEIPQSNYVMHTMHCARNISLCPICKEPIPKGELEAHKSKHQKLAEKRSSTTSTSTQLGSKYTTTTWKNDAYTGPLAEKLGHSSTSNGMVRTKIGQSLAPKLTPKLASSSGGAVPKVELPNVGGLNIGEATTKAAAAPRAKKPPNNDLSPCKYCELELPKDTMKEHEDYCGTRTDKCIECGEFVMFKYKKLHEESNHGFIKLSDEPGPKPSWDSSTQRTSVSGSSASASRRSQYTAFDSSTMLTGTSVYNVADYLPPSLGASRYTDDSDTYRPSGAIRDQKKIDYKDLSRRLDCKTEYIRNLLHDSASITAPLRTTATQPRNHFNHNKGPAPQPPAYRRPNPPTELTIPCEFCHTPIPHEDLIQHETGCRPDLARFNPRRRRQEEEFYRYTPSPPPAEPASPEVELPCEFCSDMIPASQLLRHQATCN